MLLDEGKMIRPIFAAAAVLALVSTAAVAQTDSGSTTKIIRTNPDGTAHKTIVHRHTNRYGETVTHKKSYTEGVGSGTRTRTRTVTDPATGATTTITRKTETR
jgi:hypothetical protein